MSEFVVWYDSSETGAPVLNNAAGAMISVLDACLVNGFNLGAVSSIVVAAGVATVTRNGHGFSNVYGKDVLIEGATPAPLNGRKTLTFVDTNTFKFDAPGVADGTATGSITAKRAPLGWIKQFTGTNKAIYKRSDVAATQMMLRVVDTNAAPASATDARAQMVESATDVDTFIAASPTSQTVSDGNGYYWNRGANSAAAKLWVLVGDGKRLFFFVGATSNAFAQAMFGDFSSLVPADAFNCVIVGAISPYNGASSPLVNLHKPNSFTTSQGWMVAAKAYTQVGAAAPLGLVGIGSGNIGGGAGDAAPLFPSPVDSGLVMMPNMIVNEENTSFGHPARGFMPALIQLLARQPFTNLQIVEPVVSLPGRKVLAISTVSQSIGGQLAIDITGPWG